MKLITANLLNRFWKNGVKPIKTAIDSHISAKATKSLLGNVKLTDSAAVTDTTGLALAATEKNASINGTLANQISQLNTDLKYKDITNALSLKFGITGLAYVENGVVVISLDLPKNIAANYYECSILQEYAPRLIVSGNYVAFGTIPDVSKGVMGRVTESGDIEIWILEPLSANEGMIFSYPLRF